MPNAQLNVWIDQQYKDQLEHWKREDNKPGMNVIVEELIEAEIARRSGKIVEQQSLPVIREIVRSEVREATAQLRREVRLDRELEQTELRDYLRKSFDRLAGLSVQAIRHSGVSFRLAYSALAKLSSVDSARSVYKDAKEAVERQLFPPRKAQQPPEEQDV
jgi:hypothetical protein